MYKITSAKEDQEARMIYERDERRLKRKEKAGNSEKLKAIKKSQAKNKRAIVLYSFLLVVICAAAYQVLFG